MSQTDMQGGSISAELNFRLFPFFVILEMVTSQGNFHCVQKQTKIITFLCLYVINHQFHPQFLIDPQPVNMSTQRASVHKHDFEEPDAKKPKMIDGRVEALKIKIDQLQVEMQANVDRVENKKLVRVCEGVNANRKLIEVMEKVMKQMEEMETKYKKWMEEMESKYKKQIGEVNGDSQFRGGQNIADASRYVPMGPPLSDHLEVLIKYK